ncbi:hypothetical protein VCV51_032693 [Vibrio cholerae V51]|uniref:hypothetical protein n=1 Tax=Vibrio cholerae TaxID=666 RepID=UPI00005F45EE|nr:hypothetical protein [Vibrio cholerae]EMC8696573.1 hypothetical protein [Vibrio cholerae]KFD96655.1 hypothetical protein DN33_169 [Vibrio cholerae]KNA58484.1 hypothetical protein VCV51_032693 [Vibrio cholerae V51]GIB64839.1 hypothetical protein VCSRO141_0645 [Vibrio cholerae]HCF7740801.1 hypothetical protein [Vibrio cholerae]
MTDFINSFIAELLTQISDLSFGDVIQWWIAYLIGCWVLTGMANGFAAKKRFDMRAEEAAQLEQFRFRAYNIAYSMVSEVVNGNPYVAQVIRDKIVNAYHRGESTL